ncbi:putative siderophore transport system ATP-binding protein YusV [Pullulanibacillus camelliae]|uniref:Putative siderophore transport system ATP-binding protein YusV n=1 Tax=Pullulanibacillus camelliae TaxID=1707096 RepID=A0A8J2YKM4_9BACL|nr:ABC transporter ATP-binding protein [Pullulanibacillus camelliae]GGE49673.1 putative siderophore transport system ATP-binding protein YusV [Pullulanibacillus camelliae]
MNLEAQAITVGYGDDPILEALNLQIPKGKVTVFIGKNGCGKSTLLSTFARLIKPSSGSVVLNGRDIAKTATKKVARDLALLPQGPVAPEGLTILQLVRQGRYPYQSWLSQWSVEDENIVRHALKVTNLEELSDRPVDSLSGGQRQRAWIAMVLAQNTDILLLDEPTTYLDLAHQVDILDLLFALNRTEKRTIAMVLHDINLACRYADHIVAVNNKKIYAQGAPENIITTQLMKDVFQMDAEIVMDPLFGTPMCIPHGRGRNLLKQKQQESTKTDDVHVLQTEATPSI